MATAAKSPVRRRSIQAKYVMFAVFGLMTLFVLFTRDIALLDANSPMRQRYATIPWLMLAHGIFGAAALFLAPFQFSTRLRQKYLQLHRVVGRIYVGSVIISAPVAVAIAVKIGPPILVMAASTQSFCWIVTTATALYCIRAGRVQQHREWMMRSYPFAMVFVVVRVIIAIPAVEKLGLLGLTATVWSVIAVACFLPSFLIAWKATFAARPAAKAAAAAAATLKVAS